MLDSALREGNSKVFAAHLGGQLDGHEIAELRLGKKAEAAYERAGEAAPSELDRYAYARRRPVRRERRRPGPRRRRA